MPVGVTDGITGDITDGDGTVAGVMDGTTGDTTVGITAGDGMAFTVVVFTALHMVLDFMVTHMSTIITTEQITIAQEAELLTSDLLIAMEIEAQGVP